MSCWTHWEWLTHPITENGYTHFRCFDIISHHQLQDTLRISVHPAVDDNLLQQLKSRFKITINWNKYRSEETIQKSLDHLIDRSCQGVNRIFEDNANRTRHTRYFLPKVEIKDCNDWWKKLFDHVVKNDLRTYNNIQKTATGQGDDYTSGCVLDYPISKKHCKMIAIDLSKQ